MNIVTCSILNQLGGHSIQPLLVVWDEIERIVIETYKQDLVREEEASRYPELREQFLRDYRAWEGELRPYWRKTSINGVPVNRDPFLVILDNTQADQFRRNWEAMQHLPPARETINQYLLGALQQLKGEK